MKLLFIGATHEVTGSCTYLEACGKRILIDYGMEQGRDTYENIRVPCAPAEIDYVFLTHAHIDHSGLLPLLYAGGFRGEIHATQATVSLCQIMLRDSAHIQEFEAEWRNRKAKRSGGDVYTPLYTMQEALGSLEHFVAHPYKEKITVAEGITIRFLDAGHLLGSSSIEIWLTENGKTRKLLVSGDIGNFHQPLIRDPQYADSADYVIMESTYGNRLHEKPKDYIQDFVKILLETFQRGGSVIIPSFAVGRTQELLYFLKQIKDQNLLGAYQAVPIYVDSPLAIEATEIFQRNKESCFDEEALAYVQRGENPIGVSGLRTAVTSEASMAINADARPKIVISASGMCEAGRIKHHLKHNLWKPENTILFVGYQAVGSLGRRLLEGANYVTLFGESVKVAAQIRQLSGMSGHADQKGLQIWIQHVQDVKKVFVVHGETAAADTFTALLNEQQIPAYAPYSGTEFDLMSGQFLHEAAPVYLEKPKSAKASATYDRLQIALDRVTAYIQNARGYSNKELAKMADQLTQLCNKWEQ
ncbi:MAG: MBL fold metallo-hydrolase [Oscillospiraceae bacterium]|nr:MBL fold metallo-hydrolase [Oscillospiraceae bacterium]